MVFNSVDFLIFFPVVFMVYFLFPKKVRYIWLLVASYYFYMCWNPKYIILLLFSTVVTYISGIVMDYCEKRVSDGKKVVYKKLCVASSCILNLVVLFFFKYYNFAIENVAVILKRFNIQMTVPTFDILLPVGISFYIFQAISYTLDVYRNEIKAEKNFLKYALFVSFFPQLVAGPIERSKNLLKQINIPTTLNISNVKTGLLIMSYGLFMKVVVADNIALIVDRVFANYRNENGMILMGATILFAFQIYCDFAGYSELAIGSAKVLGFSLSKNFDTPYLAMNIKDFWRRWHISLTSWFRDYLYIPLGGNRKGKIRKYLNNMIIFLASGIWHGAAWHYIFWGGLNGLYIVIQDITEQIRMRVYEKLNIKREMFAWKIFSVLVTFMLVDISWLFFRAGNMKQGIEILYKIVEDFRITYFISDAYLGMFGSTKMFMIITVSLGIVLVIDILKYRGINVIEKIYKQQCVTRYIIYFSIVMMIIIWGAYGLEYEQAQFIYFQF